MVPQPMLARAEAKDGLQVRSCRGWNMTDPRPRARGPAVRAVFDGELVSFGDDGGPRFPLLSNGC